MSEASLHQYVITGLKAHDAWPTKHNDRATPGIADISYTTKGCRSLTVWTELKAVEAIRPYGVAQALALCSAEQQVFLKRHAGFIMLRRGNMVYELRDCNGDLLASWERSIKFSELIAIQHDYLIMELRP